MCVLINTTRCAYAAQSGHISIDISVLREYLKTSHEMGENRQRRHMGTVTQCRRLVQEYSEANFEPDHFGLTNHSLYISKTVLILSDIEL